MGARSAFFAILGTALVLRAWGIASGLPYAVGVDEPQIMDRVVRMMKTGDFNPHFFDWPSLTIYVHLVVACLVFLAGAMRGAWQSLAQVGPADLYVPARMVTVLIGTATVGVLFAAARRWGVATALLAAALLAVAPNHTRESHYVLTDVPTAFFSTLALLMSLRALEQPAARAFAVAGLTVGLAASCKYNGSIAVVLPLVAALAAGGTPLAIAQRALLVGGGVVTGFLLGTPYAVLDLPRFLNDYARLASVFAQPRGGEAGWALYLKYLAQSLGWAGLIAALCGVVLSIRATVMGPARARSVMLAGFTLAYYYVMATSHQIYGRYTLPLLPFVALLAAIGVATVARTLRPRVPARLQPGVIAALVLVLLTPPAVRAISFDRTTARSQTVDLAYRWIDTHVPDGVIIVAETYPSQLVSTRFRISSVAPLRGKTFEQYAADGVDYVLISAAGYDPAFKAPDNYREAHAAYLSLFKQAREVASFTPSEEVPGPGLKLLQVKEGPAPLR
jgi:hypothetical protein